MDTKKLRQKILDLAIHGKLVPQDPNDEPASVLLERIRAEKEALIKEGKIKRAKKATASTDTSHYENVPFEVPEGWCWTTVGEVSSSILYGVSESAKEVGTYKLLRITDIQDNCVNWESVPFTDFDKDKATTYLLQDGDILFARTGATVGKSYLVSGLTEESIYASYLIRVQTSHSILPEYIKRFFESGYYWEQISLSSVGIGQPNVNGTTLASLNVPIPPYREQLRIVEEVNRWLSLADILDDNTRQVDRVVESAKSKILDLAIHGKLVPQDPKDEPASELLKRINPKAIITGDNPHYENVPTGWTKTRLGNLINIVSGVSYNKSDITSNSHGIRILRGGNVQNGKIILEENDVYVLSAYHDDEKIVKKGDIVIVASTGSQLLIGKTGYAKHDFSMTQIGAFLRIIRTKTSYLSSYINLVLCSDSFKEHIQSLAKGTNINNLKANHVTDFEIIMPPYREQQRIVVKVEELHRTLDKIAECLS